MKAGGREPIEISRGKTKAKGVQDTAAKAVPLRQKPAAESAAARIPKAEPDPLPLPRTAVAFLERLSLGDAIATACAAVGVSRAAYEKWRERHPGFREAVEAAREQHREWVRGGLLEDDVYAMQLLSRIMRDENQPVPRRHRAATQILNRRGKRDWVPEAIPATASLRPWNAFLPEAVEAESDAAAEQAAQSSAATAQSSTATAQSGTATAATCAETRRAGAAAAGDSPQPESLPSEPLPASPEPPPHRPPSPQPPPAETRLTDAWLSATFLHRHEPRQSFERLLANQVRAYAPATPQEELLTFRLTQKAWVLRRLDTWERAVSDSAVTRVRGQHPSAAPAACIATMFLEARETDETRFFERTAKLRREHEAMYDRLESKLLTLQARRLAREDRQRGGARLGLPARGMASPAHATTAIA
jgi:hypothetical protein